ncbi:SdpI family protein [Cytophaga sp. FL35]|uniref:SdpI family protein n=1 Tax=Cytophaga sp. FL35 TaxID=1904456 RepID=UPI001653A1D8|nr:SdpI family protein [Cytophaga sp. FL35]MBC6998576.1 SdpI family protein [Cytophaga sp. FL35]
MGNYEVSSLMSVDNILFVLPSITGVVFILSGSILYKYPPKKINWWYGYRTSTSIKSKERWDFAQKYSGKLMMKLGMFLIIVGPLGLFFNYHEIAALGISMALVILVVILLIVQTETAIKKRFPKKESE